MAGFCTTEPSRRITVVYGVIVHAIRFKNPLITSVIDVKKITGCGESGFPARFLADPTTKLKISSQRRWEDPPQRIREPDLGIHPPASSDLLIPAVIRTVVVTRYPDAPNSPTQRTFGATGLTARYRRQLVLPVATTIFAGRDGVIIRYGGTVDYRPTNQAIEAETYGRQDTGNGSGQGWDERAFSAQVAEWAIAVAGETGASVAHSARSLRRGVGG